MRTPGPTRKNELSVVPKRTLPRRGHDRTDHCLCAFRDRSPPRCNVRPRIRWQESRRCGVRDFLIWCILNFARGNFAPALNPASTEMAFAIPNHERSRWRIYARGHAQFFHFGIASEHRHSCLCAQQTFCRLWFFGFYSAVQLRWAHRLKSLCSA